MVESAGDAPAVTRNGRATRGAQPGPGRNRHPSPTRMLLALAFALLMATGGLIALPAAHGQTPTAGITLAAFEGDDPFTVDGDDELRATVANPSPLPASGSVQFYHPDPSSAAHRFATVPFSVEPHTNTTVVLAWDGRVFGTPLTGTQPVHAKLVVDAGPEPGDTQQALSLTFIHHAVDVVAVTPADDAVAPGGLAEQEFRVTNAGNRADNFTLGVADATPGWTFFLDQWTLSDVAPGATRTVTLTVAAPRDAAADAAGSANVTARATGSKTAVDTASTATFGTADLVSFELTGQPADHVAAAGQTVDFTVHVANRGNQPVTLALDSPLGLDVTLDDDELELEPGQQATVDGSATVPDDAVAGAYLAAVAATDPATGAASHAWITVLVEPEPAFDVTGPEDIEVAPEATGTFLLTLENQGNVLDRYRIALDDVPAGWAVDPADAVRVVGPGEETEVAFDVTVPAGTDAGTYDVAAVAVPTAGTHDEAKTLALTVTVPETAVPVFSAGSFTLPIDEDDGTAVFPITVRNAGNTQGIVTLADAELQSSEPDDASLWQAQWQGGSTAFTLAPGATAARTLQVTGPDDGVDETSEAVFQVEATIGQRSAVAQVTAQTPMPDLAVDAIHIETPVHAGEPATVTVHVANVGTQDVDGDVTVRVNATRQGVEVFTHDATVGGLAGQGGGTSTATLTVPWTPDSGGAYAVAASIDPDDEVAEKHGDDDAVGTNNATVDAFVRVEDVVLVAPAAGDIQPGQRIHLAGAATFEVRNLGNVDEYVRVGEASAPAGWNVTALAAGPMLLGPGQTVPVGVVVDAPARPGPADAPIQLKVTTDDGDLTGVVLLRVDDRSAPTIHNVTAEPSTRLLGDPVEIVADVTDATQVAWVHATVTAEDGAPARVALSHDPDDASRWTGTFVASAPGSFVVTAVAADVADPPNVASWWQAPVPFDVVVDPTPPVVSFIAPASDGAPIKGASGLNFTVADPYGVEHVTVRVHASDNASDVVAEHTFASAARYRVPLDGLPEANFVAVVRAENAFGATAEVNRAFHVDNTPPTIVHVRFLANGDGGFAVTAQVSAAGDLSAVEVRLRLADGTLQRVPMENASVVDRYTAHVPAVNMTRWWVVAWDAVGNEEVREFAPVGGALGGSSSPAWAAPLVLLAVAFVPVVMRRRTGA